MEKIILGGHQSLAIACLYLAYEFHCRDSGTCTVFHHKRQLCRVNSHLKYTNVLVKDKFSSIIPFFHDLHASFINPMSVRKNEAAFLVAGLPACPAGS